MLGAVVDDDIGNLGGGIQGDTERCQARGLQMDELVFGVADVEDHAAGGEGGAEVFDDGLDEQAPAKFGRVVQSAIRETQAILRQQTVRQAEVAGQLLDRLRETTSR